jgi:hypothetical protein
MAGFDFTTQSETMHSGWPDWAIFRLLGDFLFWAFFKNDRHRVYFCAIFPCGNSYALILSKQGLGYILWYFFASSSSHSGCTRPRRQGDLCTAISSLNRSHVLLEVGLLSTRHVLWWTVSSGKLHTYKKLFPTLCTIRSQFEETLVKL